MDHFPSINFLAVLVAIIINQVIGALWYSPVLFGKTWMKESGIDPDSISKKDAASSMIRAFLYSIVSFLILAYLIVLMGDSCNYAGLLTGFLLGVFVAVQMAINGTFDGISLKLYLLNAMYPLISYTIGGLIIGIW